MDPKDFPYDRFLKIKAEKEQRLIHFLNHPTTGEVPVVIRQSADVFGSLSQYRDRSLELQLDAMEMAMQMKTDFLFSYLEPWHGVGVYANIFGSPVNWNDYDAPQTHYLYHSIDELKDLKRPRILDSELATMVLETIRYFREKTGDQLDIALTDTQSPNDSASLILDTCEFFAASLAEPERIMPLMDMVTEVMIEFSEMQFEALGPTATRPGHIMLSAPGLTGIAVSDDNMAVISRAAYRNGALPYNSRLGEHFGGIALHTCGDFKQNYALVKQVTNLKMIDCAISGADPNPNDSTKLAEAFAGSGILIKARVGGEEHWNALAPLIRPDLKLIVQIDWQGDLASTNTAYERIKEQCSRLSQ